MKRILVIASVILATIGVKAQDCPYNMPEGAVMETYTYAVKGQDTLRLDFFRMKGDTVARPTMILSFGGGWWTGSRFSMEPQMYLRKGFNVASIDYRISLEQMEYIDLGNYGYKYARAIDRAVEDTFDATRYLLDHSKELGIDPARIVLAGCSAGAINSIMAEYLLCNEDPMATTRLPAGFNYAGVISGAGGVWKLGLSRPSYKWAPCPHLFIHGTADDIVPFGVLTVPESNFSCWGPVPLTELFSKMGWRYDIWFIEGVNHDAASIPSLTPDMVTETGHIYDFLDKVR